MPNFFRIIKAMVRRSRAGLNAFSRYFFGIDYATLSYSQYGEDMVLKSIFTRFPSSYKGFYVDVGAHHPKRFSNTYFFYSKGWRGICIDPIPGGAELFAKQRKRDVFLGIGVSESEGEIPYYIFKEPALNTFSEESLKEYSEAPVECRTISTLSLCEILIKHLPDRQVIDFLSIDAEYFDLKVIRSNDWQRFRPRVVVIEEISVRYLNDISGLEIDEVMKQNNYLAISRIPSGLFYVDASAPDYDGDPFLKL